MAPSARTSDPRFDLGAWASDDAGAAASAKRARSSSEEGAANAPSEASDARADAPAAHGGAASDDATPDEAPEDGAEGPVLTTDNLEEFRQKQRKRGIIYVSRIPPGMTPAKVRHIFSQFGEIGRIYLQPKNKNAQGKAPKKSSHFSEGWIEFESKKVARATADMLNAQPIGALGGSAPSSRRSHTGTGVVNRWKDDVWTMKYLKGFRWPMLMEQMCT